MDTAAQPIPDFTAYLITGRLDLSQNPEWQKMLARKVAKWLREGGNIVQRLDEGGADNYERLRFAQSLLKAVQKTINTVKLTGGHTGDGDYVKVVNYAGSHSFRVEVKGRQASNAGGIVVQEFSNN